MYSSILQFLQWIFVTLRKNKKSKKHKEWCKCLQRRSQSSDLSLLKELRDEPLDFLNYLRRTETMYQKMLSLVFPLIKNNDTVMSNISTRKINCYIEIPSNTTVVWAPQIFKKTPSTKFCGSIFRCVFYKFITYLHIK